MAGQIISIQSPTRVDLAGGTIDLWPIHAFLGRSRTVNLAISIQTEAVLQTRDAKDPSVSIESLDFKKKWQFTDAKQFLQSNDRGLAFFQALFRSVPLPFGFDLKTRSESPVGGGLGGSSSLLISCLKAFLKARQEKISIHDLVHLAHNVEAEVLQTPTGQQDYYPAVTGGLCALSFHHRGIELEQFDFAGTPLQTHFLLVYTGQSHHSGINNFEVLKKAVERRPETWSALRKLNSLAEDCYEIVRTSSWNQMPELFRQEYHHRTLLEPSFGSPQIEEIRNTSLQAGADAVKICGAGGGGCVLLWVEPSKQKAVTEACLKKSFQVLNARPVASLAQDSAILG